MPRRKISPDPIAGFTDMQWYMYHQRNVAFFGAYTRRSLDSADLIDLARALLVQAPQLGTGYRGAATPAPLSDDLLSSLIYRENVDTLAGFPDRWVDTGEAIFASPDLPLFRLRHAAAATPTADGRHGFLLVQVAHALAEGLDSALASRSRPRAPATPPSPAPGSSAVRTAAWLAGTLLPPFHLLAAHLGAARPGPYAYASRTMPRERLAATARRLGVRQRALLFALAMQTLFDADDPDAPARISAAYSSVSDAAASGDAFVRMRMLFARFARSPDLAAFARTVDARLTLGESRETGFNALMNARGVRMHRRLARLLPFAYGPKLFQFTPFDIVLALLPPHRLAGPLARDLIEPIYAGAALEGVNACVIVPTRQFVTFNFYVAGPLRPRIGHFEALVDRVSPLVHPGILKSADAFRPRINAVCDAALTRVCRSA